jgi:ABC-type sugar transport system ATPase subunit
MSGLTIQNIHKSFDSHTVLTDISFSLEAGELLVLLGPSGCGKSTLLRLIAGLESPDAGEIHINGRRVDNLPPKERRVAMVFQNYSLYPHMSVEKNLAFPLKVAGSSRSEIAEKVEQVAAMLDLTEKLQQKPAQLSGGQRQRVALGRAIIRKPSLFLLDEPLSNLDADLRARMRTEIVRIQRELEVTTIHVTHDQAEALTMADRIALLNEGHLEQIGTPEELYAHPRTTFVARFIGQPRMNFVPSVWEEGKSRPFGLTDIPDEAKRAGDFLIGVRPEAIRFAAEGAYGGKVVYTEYLGDEYVVRLEYESQVLAVSRCPEPHEPGDLVRFSLKPDSLYYFDRNTGLRLGD